MSRSLSEPNIGPADQELSGANDLEMKAGVEEILNRHPEDHDDPGLFRVDLSALGMGTSRVVFSRVPDRGTTALHVELAGMPMSFQKQPATRDPRMWAKGALGVLGVATAAAAVRRRRGPCKEVRT